MDDFSGDVFGASAFPADKKFGIIVVQDADNSLSSSTNPTLNAGDIIIVTFSANSVFGNDIGNRKTITIELKPEFGAPGYAKVVTPASYGSDKIIELK